MANETLHVKNKLDDLKATDNSKLTGGATVSVASKMPFPFILQLHDWREHDEPVLGGGVRRVKQAARIPNKTIRINGNSWAYNKGPHQQLNNGYAVTHGVPKDFFDAWYEQNKDADFIVNKMIFASPDAASITAQAAELRDNKSGLERLEKNAVHKHGFTEAKISDNE